MELIKEESPWKEEIEQLSEKKFKTKIDNFFARFGQIDFQKLFLLLTGFRNIPEEK